ncbi:putative two-component response regulator [Arthrobacter globiformis NBRC 12137]|jgi:serine/threonine-protein kinase|uniref:Putative two-component response regulator n=1 Tax=Arthrobacter globiformis (strain ATCC 8010 / DSM 20124 / JCM 1332 / NBRC 12137 / NCIMB 8907 / NRRL B-2979 / 168) TaxID=1077972 RepID=H0QJP4_ARTG1|nr:response regulator transcription factor [Arthrobacter globiformis]GAB13045.1 putative two-component response regulator [Arthrobacter globiformis NBRC 12137]
MTLRVAIADDSALLRRGLSALLESEGLDVVGEAADGEQLLEIIDKYGADVAVVDIRMPPSYSVEGIHTAEALKSRYPELGVLLLSQYVETENAMFLLKNGAKGLGYLLKERVSDVDEFIDALHRVSSGGTAIDPDLVSRLIARPHKGHDPGDELTSREKSVLELMAEGRTNQAIGKSLFLGERTVEAHIRSIFLKLDLRPEPEDHRRVLAVLTYLRGVGARRGGE